MKIHFCDLCNESVPDSDFAKGKAFLRNGRVICATCEALMSATEEEATRLSAGVGPGAGRPSGRGPSPAAQPGAPASVAPVAAPAGGSSGAWIGVVALLVAGAGAWAFSGELQAMEERDAELRGSLENELRTLGADLDSISLSAQRRDDDLESRLRVRVQQSQSELESVLSELREELLVARTQVAGLDEALARIDQSQQDGSRDRDRRLDDLMAQSMKSRKELDALSGRIDRAELEMDGRALAAAPNQVQAPVGPKWTVELADLTSDVAGTRWNAVQSLGETGDPEVVPHLIPLLGDDDVFVRMAVARVFGDLASPLSIEPLINGLDDEEAVVREAAMAALHLITGRDFRFDPNAKAAERSKRVKAWRDWWEKAREQYFGDV